MQTTKEEEKKQRLLAALEQGMVMVHLDARRPGVRVPEKFCDEAHLRLNLSYRFDPPDLSVSEWGVRSTLRFSGARFTVAIPWSALFAITSHVSREFWLYPDDMPPELLQHAQPPDPEAPPPPAGHRPELASVPRHPAPAPLRQVDGEGESGPDGDDEPPAPRPRGHLRLVK